MRVDCLTPHHATNHHHVRIRLTSGRQIAVEWRRRWWLAELVCVSGQVRWRRTGEGSKELGEGWEGWLVRGKRHHICRRHDRMTRSACYTRWNQKTTTTDRLHIYIILYTLVVNDTPCAGELMSLDLYNNIISPHQQPRQCNNYNLLMYKTAVYTLVNGAITHQKPQI